MLTQKMVTVQVSRSSAVVSKMWVPPRRKGEQAVARAASTRPFLPAPNRAAIRAAMTTSAPPARAGMTRMAVGLLPPIALPSRVSSGVSGG
jgi:hypothetical protein